MRQFRGQINKEGLIIDERFNSGGQIPDRFIELLDRPVLSYWGVRDGSDWQWPPVANFGPKVMLINGWSGSGGDAFPYFFREAGLGPLIGMRTWGGVIGIWPRHQLVDGSETTQPEFSFWFADVGWGVENYGTDPEIEVDNAPQDAREGRDRQLEKALETALKLAGETPIKREFGARPVLRRNALPPRR